MKEDKKTTFDRKKPNTGFNTEMRKVKFLN